MATLSEKKEEIRMYNEYWTKEKEAAVIAESMEKGMQIIKLYVSGLSPNEISVKLDIHIDIVQNIISRYLS